MRFSVKAKLAASFGVVILLSMIAGAVGYTKLSDTIATTESIVAAAGRMEKAMELDEALQLQVRNEKNALLSTSDAEFDRFTAENVTARARLTKVKDEIYAAANESGRKLLDQFGAQYALFIATQDETLKLGKTDRARGGAN